jgi:hypothetical protein
VKLSISSILLLLTSGLAQGAGTTSALTEDERWILDRGEISSGAYIAGGILGTYPLGLGIGHAIQGRYSRNGYIFTLTQVGAIGIMTAGVLNCIEKNLATPFSNGISSCNNALTTIGAVAYVGVRIWEIIDLWSYPPDHNRRYRSLKERSSPASVQGWILPASLDKTLGIQLGLTLRL